jgi:hypothetical protein
MTIYENFDEVVNGAGMEDGEIIDRRDSKKFRND